MGVPEKKERMFANNPGDIARELMGTVIARDVAFMGSLSEGLNQRIGKGLTLLGESNLGRGPGRAIDPYAPEAEDVHIVARCLGFETSVEVVAENDPLIAGWEGEQPRYLLALAISRQIHGVDAEVEAYDITQKLFDTTFFDFINDEYAIDDEDEKAYYQERNEVLKKSLVKLLEPAEPSSTRKED